MLLFTNSKAYIDGSWKTGLEILVDQDKIVDIKPQGSYKEAQAKIVDVKGTFLTPGFVDIHIHGSNGADVMDAKEESLQNISNYIAGNGTTSWLATTMTVSINEIRDSLHAVGKYMDSDHGGAQILGVHLEGPFLSPLAKGAHAEEHIILPTIDNYKAITDGIPDIVRLITIAPEQEGALELVPYLKERRVTASLGHTKCTYQQCCMGIEAGMNHVCHFYNAMTPLIHREPGAVGAIFDNDSTTIELIADLVHIHPAALRLAVKAKGPHKTVLITDAMSAAGLADGEYELGGLPVTVKNGEARQDDGTLAGSTLSQDVALRNMIKIGIASEDVIPMLTETPAREIGADHYKGKLAVGHDADINILDEEFFVQSTYTQGKLVKK